jgi:hypothetical protein
MREELRNSDPFIEEVIFLKKLLSNKNVET